MEQVFTDAQRTEFEERGYVRRGVCSEKTRCVRCRSGLTQLYLARCLMSICDFSLTAKMAYMGTRPRKRWDTRGLRAYRKIMDLEQDPLFLRYAASAISPDHASLHGGERVHFRAMFMNKPADRGTELPWHQDVGWGWGVDTTPTITAWTALDPSTRDNGCMQVIPRESSSRRYC